MSIIDLTQAEADALMQMEKHRVDDAQYFYPPPGKSLHIPLLSIDRREEFMLDVTPGYIKLEKYSFQNRARKCTILVRVCVGGRGIHRNPDGEEISCPHIHLYKEGFGDKWAYPLSLHLTPVDDTFDLLMQFMNFCHIVKKPNIQRNLFL